MASLVWQGGSSAVWSTAGNWSTGSAPVDNDLVYVDGRGNKSRIAAEDQSSIELDLLQIDLSYTQSIGTVASALQIGADKLVIGQGAGVPSGPLVWHISLTTDPADITVVNTHPQGVDGLPPLLLTANANTNTYTQMGGSVGIGIATPATACEIKTLYISGGYCTFGTGVTFTAGGAMHVSGNAHVVTRSAVPNLVVTDNALVDLYGIGATFTNLTVLDKGTVRVWARASAPTNSTIGTLQIGDYAVLDARVAAAQLTIASTLKQPGPWKIIGFPGQVVHTDAAVQYTLAGKNTGTMNNPY